MLPNLSMSDPSSSAPTPDDVPSKRAASALAADEAISADKDSGSPDKKPDALRMLSSERPRDLGWVPAGAMLFGDWGTSRLYVLGLAFLVAGRTAIWLIALMSLLILAVGWAYTHICRLYPDGGGVYTAGKRRARILGVVCALLLFADYTITASLSSVEAFHYFGIHSVYEGAEGGGHHEEGPSELTSAQEEVAELTGDQEALSEDANAKLGRALGQTKDAGDEIILPDAGADGPKEVMWKWPPSPGMWAIFAIIAIGCFNLLGPGHTSTYAIFAAVAMMFITVLVVAFAIPQIHWSSLQWGNLMQPPTQLWQGFVYIVLALSGVEAIANLTGVMRKPVFRTASKSIWLVAGEVALFNLLLAVAMIALTDPTMTDPIGREAHKEDMMAYMAFVYIGPWGEWLVRIVAGVLLLSATNTAINGLLSIVYVMSRDGEMPSIFQKLNSFGSPWVAALVAASVPAFVLLFFNDLASLASLYAIGVVAAVAIDCTLAGLHPRLRGGWRKFAIVTLGMFLVVVWVTLAFTKIFALIFVTIVMAVGLSLRQLTQYQKSRRPKPSLLSRAISDQLSTDALLGPKVLVASAGGTGLAEAAVEKAKQEDASLVVCFVRDVALDARRVGGGGRFNLQTDEAAAAMLTRFLEVGHEQGVAIIPSYDVGTNTAELIAESAALNNVESVIIGSSRRGALHQLIKGKFQKQLESLLPDTIKVEVVDTSDLTAETAESSH